MKLHIAQVNNVLFDGEASAVTVPALDGEMTVLPHHEPFISTLKAGEIIVKTESGQQTFAVTKGVLEISNNQTTILL